MIIQRIHYPASICNKDTFERRKPSFTGVREIKKPLDPEQVDKFVKRYSKEDKIYLKSIITKAGNLLSQGLITIQIYDSHIRTAILKLKGG